MPRPANPVPMIAIDGSCAISFPSMWSVDSMVGVETRWQEVLVGQRVTLFGKTEVEGLAMVDWSIPRPPTSVLVLIRLAAEHCFPSNYGLHGDLHSFPTRRSSGS